MDIIKTQNTKDIVDIEKSINSLLDKTDKINQITTRNIENQGLQTFTEEKMEKIAEFMPEINRAMNSFGRTNTQATNKLMTLTMLNGAGNPYRLLRQTLSEIDKKRSALKENTYRLKKTKIKLFKLEEKYRNEKDDFDKQLIKLKIEQKQSQIQDSMLLIEGALKDIASFQDAYEQIRTHHNIPENWDEKDMEEAEPAFHTRRAFELLYRDLIVNGRPGMGTIEYLSQFGIHVQTAELLTREYIQGMQKLIEEGKLPTQESLDVHLDSMMETFKDSYKSVLTRLGIDNYVTDFAQFTDTQREHQRLENKGEDK